jgi:hypothetical protein
MYDEPDYMSASPTVMSYDYSTGDYFAPAYLGQQTPAQANAAAVRAVGPTGMEIAQPAPLVGHPTPNYPRVGHTPTFDMPMNKGEWNIKGVNMPTYSPALPPMPGSDWATFPQPIDGAQLDFSRPQFSAYSGHDYGAATGGFGKSREVAGSGGYRYRQFSDGSIQILISADVRNLPPGTVLRDDASQPAAYRRWAAITNEIGAWRDFVNARTSQILAVTTDTALKLAASQAPRRKRRSAAAPVEAPPVVMDQQEEPSSFLSGPLPWIIGGSVIVLGVVLFASRSKPQK